MGGRIELLDRLALLAAPDMVGVDLADRRELRAIDVVGGIPEMRAQDGVGAVHEDFVDMHDEARLGRLAALGAETAVGPLGEGLHQVPGLDNVRIWGDGDGITSRAHHEEIAAAIPGARLEVIAGAGHLPMLEQPGQVIPLLTAFIDG